MYHKTVSISTSTVLPAAFFAAISAVALVVSFMAASYLYARSTLIPYGVLLALSFILLELMIVVYFSLLSEFCSSIFGKKKDIPVLDQVDIVQAVPAQLIDVQASPVPPDPDNMGQTQPVNEEQTEELQAPDPTSEERAISTGHESASTDVTVPNPAQSEETNRKIVELMSLSAEEQQKKREKFAQDRKEIMQEYIYYSLGPLLDEQDILAVWLEYEGWISSSTYQPKPRLCKWKEKVTSRDVRHLTWNIAKRMGMENGYKSETCGRFVKAMFPDLCVKRDGSPCTDSYLSQNLLEEKPNDLIKIDKPEPHSIAFHFRNMEMKQAV
ncbi:hypothetical protein [Prevotella sp. P6B1]|jgi:hypothetical protein|uniref:hypothetical protein n=1 Tax=Prevotella sp. P6B1 TaxID=1410613 RepID=UPI00051CAB6B|nr:hypothetical protein [Prevotella sp. P6B1]